MVSDLVEAYGAPAVAQVLDAFKDLGFHYASQAGITISKNHIVSPPNKEEILDGYEKQAQEIQAQYEDGLHHRRGAQGGGHGRAGTRPPRRSRKAMEDNLHELNPIFMMANSGSPRVVQADPPAGRDARPDGQPEGRDHRAPDQGQLHGGPVGARVLHLHPRRPQGPRRHRAADRRLRLPDPAPGRRRPGRDRPRRRTARRRSSSSAPLRARRRQPQHQPDRPHRGEEVRDQARSRAAEARPGDRPARARGDRRGIRRRGGHGAGPLGAQVRARVAACARPATAGRWRPARSSSSATRSGSSPPSRSASRARS